jgi:subtilisin family serine protease
MDSRKSNSFPASLVVSSLVVLGVIVVFFFLFKTTPVEKELLPASVGRVLDPLPEHILLKFKSDASSTRRSQIFTKHNLKEKSEIKNIGVKIVSIPSGSKPKDIAEALNKNESDALEFAEPDFVVEPSLVPNDPWYLNWQKDKEQMNLPSAWESASFSSGITLAVIDTGVNCEHEDLKGQCLVGWNFYDNNSDTRDFHGHGTSVAGVASALGNNGIGVAGATWQSKIMPLKVTSPEGTASYSDIASAVTYAGQFGAKVVNASFQVGGSSTIGEAAKYLKEKGGLLVISEGNYGADTGYANNPDIISVSAVDSNNAIYSWSSFGSDVDLASPGCTGATTLKDGGYGSFCGTSNSAPEVAGVLMLVWSVNPNLSSEQVENIIFSSAKDTGDSGWDKYFGWGTVDGGRALSLALETETVSNPAPSPTPTTGDNIAPVVNLSSPSDGATVAGTRMINGSATDNTKIVKMEILLDGTVIRTSAESPISYKWNTKNLSAGAHTIVLRAYDSSGNTGEDRVKVYKQ